MDLVSPDVQILDAGAKVAEMIDELGCWWFEAFDTLLPLKSVLRIAAIKPSVQGLLDCPLWSRSANGQFRVRNAYEVHRETQFGLVEPVWEVVGQFRGLTKVRTFLWLLCHSKILTNTERFRRHMTSDSSCPVCACPVEDVHHVLCACPVASSIWRRCIRRD
ncbi:hypothetical protein V6N11_031291 [Hibiscus sabdariffa]|uniref:Reverse transcriptase zinc-binding domain-containing protein n=1 Tax=Hibiscus sabdariffa TaxID=183260 RepID=A0ABR2SX73_9ROSI